MGTGVFGNFDAQSYATGSPLSPDIKLKLLVEWRTALQAIVESDPDATETRKAIADIDDQIGALGG